MLSSNASAMAWAGLFFSHGWNSGGTQIQDMATESAENTEENICRSPCSLCSRWRFRLPCFTRGRSRMAREECLGMGRGVLLPVSGSALRLFANGLRLSGRALRQKFFVCGILARRGGVDFFASRPCRREKRPGKSRLRLLRPRMRTSDRTLQAPLGLAEQRNGRGGLR